MAYQLLPLSSSGVTVQKGGRIMLSWSITFLVIGLIAAVLGFTGIAGAATQIAWALFVIFIVLFIASLFMGRGRIG
jgi:uncharacterized membrane protein YtjA (UPF0391 family)